MTFSFEIPLPPKNCAQNSHVYFRTKAKADKEYRLAANLLCRAALPKEWVQAPVRISATFYCGPTPFEKGLYRPQDIGNGIGALKPAVDGFVDAKLVPDDNYKWVKWGDVEILRTFAEHKGKAGVVITISHIVPSPPLVDMEVEG